MSIKTNRRPLGRVGELYDYARRLNFPRRAAVLIIVIHTIGTVFEGAGLGMLLPIAELMISGGDVAGLVDRTFYWRYLDAAYAFVGVELGFGSLITSCVLLLLVRQILLFAGQVLSAKVRETVIARNRIKALGLYLQVNTGYQDSIAVGGFTNDITLELQEACRGLMTAVQIINKSLLAALYVAMMLFLSFTMTMTVLVVLGAGAFLLRGLLRRSEHAGMSLTHANQKLTSFLVERLARARLVRLTGTERGQMRGMTDLAERQRDFGIRVSLLSARLGLVIEPAAIVIASALLYVSYGVFEMAVAQIGLLLVVLVRLLPVGKELLQTWQSLLAKIASLRAVIKRMDAMEKSLEGIGGRRRFDGLAEAIELRDVVFAYDSPGPAGEPGAETERAALNGVTLTIPARRTTALVGPSGSGKSTLIDLIPRIRIPQAGEVLFDGVAAGEFSLASLRAGIAYVPQAPLMFDGSAADHIRYGKVDASEAEIHRAARLAGADGFLEALPQGYDTLLGEAGGRLSGGQRQRLDLARALVGEASILVLDEPTSGLDAMAEYAFREMLARLRTEIDVTIILIGHRLSTVRDADQIAVVRGGRIEDVGAHDDLLQRGGWYREAHAKQFGTQQFAAAD